MTTHPFNAAGDAEKRIHDVVASKAPIAQKLENLVRIVEELTPSGMVASILLLDTNRRHLRHGAGPSLPAAYNTAIDGIEIGREVGSCGTAAFHDQTVAVYDIQNDPRWANFKELALAHGLRACWSTPIHGADGRVVGTFANYYRVVRDPSPRDVALTNMVTEAAAAVIEGSAATA
jgi:GAF domain-containing protein